VDQLWGLDRLASLNPATGARAWYGYDGQGPPTAVGTRRQLLNDAGHVTASASYDPYGGPEGAALPSPFGYTGELTDPATGSQFTLLVPAHGCRIPGPVVPGGPGRLPDAGSLSGPAWRPTISIARSAFTCTSPASESPRSAKTFPLPTV